jgi:hypothetical protein
VVDGEAGDPGARGHHQGGGYFFREKIEIQNQKFKNIKVSAPPLLWWMGKLGIQERVGITKEVGIFSGKIRNSKSKVQKYKGQRTPTAVVDGEAGDPGARGYHHGSGHIQTGVAILAPE